jgi:hypothetical protein
MQRQPSPHLVRLRLGGLTTAHPQTARRWIPFRLTSGAGAGTWTLARRPICGQPTQGQPWLPADAVTTVVTCGCCSFKRQRVHGPAHLSPGFLNDLELQPHLSRRQVRQPC